MDYLLKGMQRIGILQFVEQSDARVIPAHPLRIIAAAAAGPEIIANVAECVVVEASSTTGYAG